MTDRTDSDRLATYAASVLVDWFAGRTGREYKLTSAIEGDTPVFVAQSAVTTLAIAIAAMWEPESDRAAEDARESMQERLTGGLVRGPYRCIAVGSERRLTGCG